MGKCLRKTCLLYTSDAADDEFVGQGRCGSLPREQKILNRLKRARVNPPTPTIHPSDEGVFKAAPSLKGGSQNEQPHPRFHQQPDRLQKEGGRIQRRLERLEWLCFDDKCNRFDALSCSSTLVSFFTRVQVSCADISPSCSHLMLDNSAGDIKGRRGFST